MFSVWNICGESNGRVEPVKRVERSSRVQRRSQQQQQRTKNPYEKNQERQQPSTRRRVVLAQAIMSQPVQTLGPQVSLREAWRFFSLRRFRHVPILNAQERLVGVLSDRDILRAVDDLDDPDTWPNEERSIADIMSTDIIAARPDASIREIAQVLFEERIGCMPIVDESGTLVGLLTRSDILSTLVNEAPLALWV